MKGRLPMPRSAVNSVLDEITPKLAGLLKTLTPFERRKLSRELAIMMRGEVSGKILANIEPDGRKMRPRLPQRKRKNSKKGAMFKRLGMRRSMRVRQTANIASVEFQPKNRRIAAVHHFGLTSRVNKFGTTAKYIRRELMGFDQAMRKQIGASLIKHLAGGVKWAACLAIPRVS